MDVLPIRTQIEDRVAHQLTGAVVRHVAAASGVKHLDAARRQGGQARR